MHSAWNFSSNLGVLGFICWIAMWGGSEGQAEVIKTVRVRGLGFILEGDKAAAFQQAKKAALREAVEEAVGTLISSTTQVQNFAVIEDNIYSHTEGYISKFNIVEQKELDEHTYEVVIDAVVSLGPLQSELQALNVLIETIGNPRILCLGRVWLIEDGKDAILLNVDLAALLMRVLHQTGANFNIVTIAELAELEEQDKSAYNQIFGDNLNRAAELAVRQQADLVIVGQAHVIQKQGIKIPFSSTMLDGTGLKTAVAQVQINILWADSKEGVIELHRTQKAAEVNREAASARAVKDAVAALASDLLDGISEDWRKRAYSNRLVRLEVDGASEQLSLFERDFSLLGGVEKIYPRNYKSSGAVYDILCKSAAFQLARRISAKGIAGLDIEIVQVSLNSLKLQLL